MDKHAHTALLHGGARDLEVFRFYLSAFLSAAMSVRDSVLRKEFMSQVARPKVEARKAFAVCSEWEGTLSPEDATVWGSMKHRRDDEVHVADMDLKRGTALIPVDEALGHLLRSPLPPQIVTMPTSSSEEGEWPKVAALAPTFVNADGTHTDVFSECRRYLVLLRALLSACEQSPPARRSSP